MEMGRDNTVNRPCSPPCECTLPPGYKFRPTDEQLISFLKEPIADQASVDPYIRHKVMLLLDLHLQDPAHLSVIHNCNHPNEQSHKYFFTKLRKNMSDGNWLPIKINKAVIASKGDVLGYKNKFIYGVQKPQNSNTSNWVMYELHAGAPAMNTDPSDDMDDEWVVCKIYKKDASVDMDKIQSYENFAFDGEESDWEEFDAHEE